MKINNSEVAHNFASNYRQSDYAENLFWEYSGTDRIIYSYGRHFPIARISGNTCFFTTNSYSRTTAHHKAYTLRACSHFDIIYCKSVLTSGYKTNFDAWEKQLQNAVISLARARKPEIYLERISDILDTVVRYCDACSIKGPRSITKYNKYISDDSRDAINKRLESIKKAYERKQAKAAKELKKTVTDWIQGKRAYISETATKGRQILRITEQKNYKVLETSKGVKFTFDQARELAAQLDTLKYGDTVLGRFRVRQNSGDLLEIGCHKFSKKYLQSFAAVNL